MRVLFLIGCDLYSYHFANEICIAFAKQNWQASFLVFRNELALHPDKLQNEIKDLIYYERTEFCEQLLPFLKNHPGQGKYLSLEALSQQYSIRYDYCQNLENSAALAYILEKAKAWNIDIAVTIRCIIKYDSTLLDYFSRESENYFWNIHPGLLPQYRGISPVFGAMLNHEINFGYTLHRVSEKLDNGPIIDTCSQPVDYSKSMIMNTLALIPGGVDLIIKNLTKVINKEALPCLIQNEMQKGYYSFPSADEIEQFKLQNMILFTKEEIRGEMENLYLSSANKKEYQTCIQNNAHFTR